MRMKVLICAACLLIGISQCVMAEQNKNDSGQRSIEALKATPVAKIEAGMPDKSLGEWLVANAKGEVQYTAQSCEASDDQKQQMGSGPFHCVTATLKEGWVVLQFVVAAREKSSAQSARCRFLFGQEGPPAGSPMKRPTRKISKLSDLRTMLGWE